MDEFIDRWHARTHASLAEGLAWLVGHDALPAPDGIVGDWVDTLCAMRFEPGDAAPIATLLRKSDPYLQEIGVRLAASFLHDAESDAIEPALVQMIDRGPLDPWVALAVSELLRTSWHGHDAIYAALVKRHGERPRGHGIMRNRGIHPWRDLEELYAQHVIQVLEPGERERAILPILERALGTKGFRATQDHILRQMGFDPEEHRARLRA